MERWQRARNRPRQHCKQRRTSMGKKTCRPYRRRLQQVLPRIVSLWRRTVVPHSLECRLPVQFDRYFILPQGKKQH